MARGVRPIRWVSKRGEEGKPTPEQVEEVKRAGEYARKAAENARAAKKRRK